MCVFTPGTFTVRISKGAFYLLCEKSVSALLAQYCRKLLERLTGDTVPVAPTVTCVVRGVNKEIELHFTVPALKKHAWPLTKRAQLKAVAIIRENLRQCLVSPSPVTAEWMDTLCKKSVWL